jgi:hypothetical protein
VSGRASRIIAAALLLMASFVSAPPSAAAGPSVLRFFYVSGVLSTPEGAAGDVMRLKAAMRTSARYSGELFDPHIFSYAYPATTWELPDTLGCAAAFGFRGKFHPARLFASLFLCADLFAQQLHDYFATTPGATIVVVGHSQGGLIALLAMNQLSTADRARVRRVVTMDTPIAGIDPGVACRFVPSDVPPQPLCALTGLFAKEN